MGSHGRWDDYDVTFTIMIIIKHRIFKCIECTNNGDEMYDVSICYRKFLKYDLS
jgi:hypothetical protein